MRTKRNDYDLFTRYDGNPILTTEVWPYPAHTCFNAGATVLRDGRTLLLVRVEDRRGISHLTNAFSADGVTNWEIEPTPALGPDPERYPEEEWGIEDPRIVWVDELKKYVVTYTAYSSAGPAVSLATTEDFHDFEHYRVVIPPDNKDAALFTERINGRFAMVHRPQPASKGGLGNMWISYSPDLKHWGDHRRMLEARRGAWWDAGKIGLSPPPIKTDHGWLIFYHGVRMSPAGCIYRLGVALMDLENPERLVRRCDEWIFGPEAEYERVGDVGDVVFPCGTTVNEKTGELRLYYGAADTTIALATANINEIIDYLMKSGT